MQGVRRGRVGLQELDTAAAAAAVLGLVGVLLVSSLNSLLLTLFHLGF